MSIDRDKIRQALNSFQDDQPFEAKNVLKQEIKNVKADFLKDKLSLEKNPYKETSHEE